MIALNFIRVCFVLWFVYEISPLWCADAETNKALFYNEESCHSPAEVFLHNTEDRHDPLIFGAPIFAEESKASKKPHNSPLPVEEDLECGAGVYNVQPAGAFVWEDVFELKLFSGMIDDSSPFLKEVGDDNFSDSPETSSEKKTFDIGMEISANMKSAQESCVIQGRELKFGSLSKRAKNLLQLLKKNTLSFGDVKDAFYKKQGVRFFQEDILQAMYHGADIRRDGKRYYCRGDVTDAPAPSEHVAIAMFNILYRNEGSLFDLKFQLYREGHRDYAPDALGYIELALAVGGVHPRNRQIRAEDRVDFCAKAKEIWRKTRISHKCFCVYIENPTPKEKAFLKNKHYARILRSLWRLNHGKQLAVLEDMKASLPPVNPFRANKQDTIIKALKKHRNKEVYLAELLDWVSPPGKKRNKTTFLGSVLTLALNDWPIFYNKDKQTVTLLEKALPTLTPAEGTNLLTMIYDLVQRYKNRLTQEEIAYYAYQGGYGPKCFKRGNKAPFYACIRQDKAMLAIMGYINSDCCAQNLRADVCRQKPLLPLVCHKDKFQSAAYYKRYGPDVTEQDIDAVCAAQEFQKSAEFTVFEHHVRSMNKTRGPAAEYAKPVENLLRDGPILARDFWKLFDNFGCKKEQDMWNIADALTSSDANNRLIYNPKTSQFSWDNDCPLLSPEAQTLVSTVFSLQNDHPDMPSHELGYMLKQYGFTHISENDVQEILRGLAVLGLSHGYELAYEREIVDLLLTPGVNPKANVGKNRQLSRPWRIAHRVVNWAHNGSLKNLWKVYEDLRIENPPPCKRKKTEKKSYNPEDVLLAKTPHLYEILQTIKSN